MALADFVSYRTDRKYSLTPASSVVSKGTVLTRQIRSTQTSIVYYELTLSNEDLNVYPDQQIPPKAAK